MKKLLFISSLFVSGLLSAQTPVYPLNEDFDAVLTTGSPAIGALPTGWTTTGGFNVYGVENLSPHGYSVPNACSVEMNSSNTQDTLYTPVIGPITANTKVSLSYRFVNKAGYPATGTTLGAGDKVVIDANIGGSWQPAVATIDNTTNPAPLSTYITYTYTNAAFATLAGFGGSFANIQLRIDVARANGDWYLDIDNFIVADDITGIATNVANAPSLSVYPNPSKGNFTISLKNYKPNNPVEVNITNLIGQKVKTITTEGAVNSQIYVNTTGLEKGMYIVEVKSGSEVAKTKIQID